MARALAEEKLYKIGEVCKLADLQPYVLRYWETEFPSLAPGKSGGGQRLYNRREVDIILRIKELLYKEGFTIAGAKKRLDQELAEPVPISPAVPSPEATPVAPSPDLSKVKQELRALLELLRE
jgi:DNA-binding transcriptional MerR regulator